MTIRLPISPSGDQFEDLLAATLRVLGYFIETRLTLREDKREVLELDVVATPVGGGSDRRILFEAKKAGFSFTNLFKLFGQITYLGIPQACLVSLKPADPKHLPVYEAKATELMVRICHYPLDSENSTVIGPSQNAISDNQREKMIPAAWFNQIALRVATAALLHECKMRTEAEVCERARSYLFNVRASFFQPSALGRSQALYNAYFNYPQLAGQAISILAEETGITERRAWNKVNDTSEWLWVQAIMHTEWTARLTIVKNALDDVMDRGEMPPPHTELKIGSISLDMPLHALPYSFHTGLKNLRDHPYSQRLPYLFQAYVDVLGGYLFFNDEEELAFIEALTGVPKNDIVPALHLLDDFFSPEDDSMFYEQRGQLLCLKLVPGFVRGAGSFIRQSAFGIEDYRTRYPEMGWLVARWHNALYQVLEPYLKVETSNN